MHSILKAPKFVLTLKPKIKQKQIEQVEKPDTKSSLPYDMLNYIASFIDVTDTFTLLSYLMAIPCALYEIKKKFALYYFNNNVHSMEYATYLYKFTNEPTRILVSTLMSLSLFNVNDLLNFCTSKYSGETILKTPNGRRFLIYLIKEQNKASQKEIIKIVKNKKGYRFSKTLHHTFPTLDILYYEQIAKISEYISCCEIDKFIYKKLQSYYKNSNIKYLNTKERALLMEHYDKDNNFNYTFQGKKTLIYNLIIKSLKLNYFNVIDILFENNLIKTEFIPNEYSEFDIYISQLQIDSDEFKKSRFIIKYFLEKKIEISSYQKIICNLINVSFDNKNYDMIKFLLSLNGARQGISILLGSILFIEPHLINMSYYSENELLSYKEYTLDVVEQGEYVLYDFLINNLSNSIDITIFIKYTLSNIEYFNDNSYDNNINNMKLLRRYIYIIEKYVENFDDLEIHNNPNHKYYCNREILINIYKILINNNNPSYFQELKIKLKEEFDELLLKEDTNQITEQILRELIKKIYYKIRIRQKQMANIQTLLIIATNDVGILERHKNTGLLLEYITKIPEFLIDNIKFKIMLIKKMNEFINTTVNENYIETAFLMSHVRKILEILRGGGSPRAPLL